MAQPDWIDVGAADELAKRELQPIVARRARIALSFRGGEFGAISGVCNHVGGPLGEGTLDGDYVVCPWHHWKFHRRTGEGEPGFEEDRGARATRSRSRTAACSSTSRSRPAARTSKPHPPHPLARDVERAPGPVRVVGISTTAMDRDHPRYSHLRRTARDALAHAENARRETRAASGSRELKFRHCEGYYSKSAQACTWPCSITQMDPADQLDQVYEAIVHWADVILVSTPIRWGARQLALFQDGRAMNCIQNQVTIAQPRADAQQGRGVHHHRRAGQHAGGGRADARLLRRDRLPSSRSSRTSRTRAAGRPRTWRTTSRYVEESKELHDGARALVERTIDMAKLLVAGTIPEVAMVGGGRKGHQLDVKAQT